MSGANWARDLGRAESADLRAANDRAARRRRRRFWTTATAALRWAVLGGL